MGKNFFSLEELSTLFCQTENVLNSMPIGLVSDDPKDEIILTPGHLISGLKLECYPTEPASQISELKHCSATARWTQIQNILCHFWNRWKKSMYRLSRKELNGRKRAPISRLAMLYMSWTTTRLPYNGACLVCHMCIVSQTILFLL